MKAHPYLQALLLDSEVKNAEVTLTGQVEYHRQKFLVEDIAAEVEGVVSTQNFIQIQDEFIEEPLQIETSDYYNRMRPVNSTMIPLMLSYPW